MKNEFIIQVDLDQLDDFFSPFNRQKLSSNLADYILRQAAAAPYKNTITLKINLPQKLSREEQSELTDIIREYFGLSVSEQMEMNRHHDKQMLFVFLSGTVLLLFSYLIPVSIIVIDDLFMIAGWVGVWETVYYLLFVNYQSRFRIKRAKQLSDCHVNFYENQSTKKG